MSGRNYTDLIAWRKSMELVESLDRATAGFPKEEWFGLRSQMRRAVIAIPSNIAEGQGRNSPRELHRFLAIAHGSLRELETQIQIAQRLNYIENPVSQSLFEQCGEVGRLINGLSKSLKRSFDE